MTSDQQLRSDSITLRPIENGDEEFLYEVFASTRLEELSIVPWNDEQKEEFLRSQFQLQHDFYHQQYADAAYQVIMSGDECIGRLYVDRRDEEIRILDIALLPDSRRAGIGGDLTRQLLDEAAQAGKPLRIHVEKNNPALGWYERLGFRQIEDGGLTWLMEWTAANVDGEK